MLAQFGMESYSSGPGCVDSVIAKALLTRDLMMNSYSYIHVGSMMKPSLYPNFVMDSKVKKGCLDSFGMMDPHPVDCTSMIPGVSDSTGGKLLDLLVSIVTATLDCPDTVD